MNLLEGADPTNAWDWPYIIGVLLTPLVVIACVLTFWGPGWFVGAFWWWLMSSIEPPEVERLRNQRRREKSLSLG